MGQPPRPHVRAHTAAKYSNRPSLIGLCRAGPDAEVLIEFGVPRRASTVRGITVRYHVGWLAYSRTFDLTLTLCPPNDLGPCGR
jgi:hypothetical protein